MKEWLWMDYPNEQQPQRGKSKGERDGRSDPMVENVEKIKDSEWDYYR
jgi:hypothetical protein